MTKIPVTIDYLKELTVLAIKHGTEQQWMDVALEWMEGAEAEIKKLQSLLKESKNDQEPD